MKRRLGKYHPGSPPVDFSTKLSRSRKNPSKIRKRENLKSGKGVKNPAPKPELASITIRGKKKRTV